MFLSLCASCLVLVLPVSGFKSDMRIVRRVGVAGDVAAEKKENVNNVHRSHDEKIVHADGGTGDDEATRAESSLSCTRDQFEQTLQHMKREKLIQNDYNASKYAHKHFYKGPSLSCLQSPSRGQPVLTDRKVVINLAEGSTATRYMDNVMINKFGFQTKHNPGCIEKKCWAVDSDDYLSDSPIAMRVPEVVARIPNAIFIFTMRDAAAWEKARCNNFGWPDKWYGASVCVDDELKICQKNPDAAAMFVARVVWLTCALPKERVLHLPMGQVADEVLMSKLEGYFRKHGVLKHARRPSMVEGQAWLPFNNESDWD